jgi:Uma2 family endonuclease
MVLPQPRTFYTVEEYLDRERRADERHEYLDGEIYEMSGESLAHSQLCISLGGTLNNQLRGKQCQPLSPNMKVRRGPDMKGQRNIKGLFSYADLTVVCGQPLFHDEHQDVLLNPTVIIEVLSPSTESFDRGDKFRRYGAWIASLLDYVLVSQSRPRIEHFRRLPDGKWLLTVGDGVETSLRLDSIDCELQLSEVYDRVEFPAEESEEPEPNDAATDSSPN